MLARFAQWYLRRRYGWNSEKLRPPIGWAPWIDPGLKRRLIYFAAYRLWLIEDWLNDRTRPPGRLPAGA